MRRNKLPIEDVKLSEGGRIRVPLSLSVPVVERLDALGKLMDLDRATVARLFMLRALADAYSQPEVKQ